MERPDQDVTTDVTDHDPWFALAEFLLRMISLLADDDQLAGLDVRNVLGGAVRPADRQISGGCGTETEVQAAIGGVET